MTHISHGDHTSCQISAEALEGEFCRCTSHKLYHIEIIFIVNSINEISINNSFN